MRRLSLACLSLALLSGCVTHTHSTEFNGMKGIRGTTVEYQSTSTWGLKFLFSFNLLGETSEPEAIDFFTAEAASRGGERVRITETSGSTYWYIFPPLSFFVHPTVTTVHGEVEVGE